MCDLGMRGGSHRGETEVSGGVSPPTFPPCSPQCLDSSIGTLSFGLKHVSLQGNADVNEFIRSLPWGFQAGAGDRIGRKFGDTERYTEGTWRL